MSSTEGPAETVPAAGAKPAGTARGESTRQPLEKRGQAAARRVAESKAVVPHLYATRTVETGALPTGDALLAAGIAAAGRALQQLPDANGNYKDGEIVHHSRANVAFTVDGERGLPSPTIFDADTKDPATIESEIAELRAGLRDGSLTSPSYSGATFTVSLAPAGADSLAPSITPGQGAHLCLGTPRESVVLIGDEPGRGVRCELVLSFDGRTLRPETAGELLEAVAGTLAGIGRPED